MGLDRRDLTNARGPINPEDRAGASNQTKAEASAMEGNGFDPRTPRPSPTSDLSETVCADCGLELADDQPPRTWSGHVHRPVARDVFEKAATVIAVANLSGLRPPDELLRMGFTAEGVRTYLTIQHERAK